MCFSLAEPLSCTTKDTPANGLPGRSFHICLPDASWYRTPSQMSLHPFPLGRFPLKKFLALLIFLVIYCIYKIYAVVYLTIRQRQYVHALCFCALQFLEVHRSRCVRSAYCLTKEKRLLVPYSWKTVIKNEKSG